jgi:hypothetical protein
MLQRPGGKQVGSGLLLSALLSIATFGASLHSPQDKKNETDALARTGFGETVLWPPVNHA